MFHHGVSCLAGKIMAEPEGGITVRTPGPVTNPGMAMALEPRIIARIREVARSLQAGCCAGDGVDRSGQSAFQGHHVWNARVTGLNIRAGDGELSSDSR